MSGHTPGPWRVNGGKGIYEHDIVGPNGEDIAYANASDGADVPVRYPVEANARLIAAAPDLLAALKDVLVVAFADAEDLEHDSICAVRKAARAAIAKAEGAQ